MERQTISTNTPWERAYGYSRAVRIGSIIEIAGTVAANEDGVPAAASVYEQTLFILRKIEQALLSAGGSLADVTRTRWYLTDMAALDEAGRAHGEIFGDIRPVATAVGISALAGRGFLIEIEASAVIKD